MFRQVLFYISYVVCPAIVLFNHTLLLQTNLYSMGSEENVAWQKYWRSWVISSRSVLSKSSTEVTELLQSPTGPRI